MAPRNRRSNTFRHEVEEQINADFLLEPNHVNESWLSSLGFSQLSWCRLLVLYTRRHTYMPPCMKRMGSCGQTCNAAAELWGTLFICIHLFHDVFRFVRLFPSANVLARTGAAQTNPNKAHTYAWAGRSVWSTDNGTRSACAVSREPLLGDCLLPSNHFSMYVRTHATLAKKVDPLLIATYLVALLTHTVCTRHAYDIPLDINDRFLPQMQRYTRYIGHLYWRPDRYACYNCRVVVIEEVFSGQMTRSGIIPDRFQPTSFKH